MPAAAAVPAGTTTAHATREGDLPLSFVQRSPAPEALPQCPSLARGPEPRLANAVAVVPRPAGMPERFADAERALRSGLAALLDRIQGWLGATPLPQRVALSSGYLAQLGLPEPSLPYLEQASAETGVTVNGVLPGLALPDTGAELDAVCHSLAERVGLQREAEPTVVVQGVTGTSLQYRLAQPLQLCFGGHTSAYPAVVLDDDVCGAFHLLLGSPRLKQLGGVVDLDQG